MSGGDGGSGGVFNIGSQTAGAVYNAGRDQTIHGGGGTLHANAINAIADLRSLLDSVPLGAEDRSEAERALEEAQAEAAQPEPDKGKVASAVERMLDVVRRGGDLAETAAKLAGPVGALLAWLGPAGAALSKLVL